jgi:predicted ATPase
MTQTTDRPPQNAADQSPKPVGFTEIGVSGFKSFSEETRIQLGSLTILAGANSSGKSSIMQPLLLMKQTLEAPYDPGALLLDGPNVSFTSGEQLIFRKTQNLQEGEFVVKSAIGGMKFSSTFRWENHLGISIVSQSVSSSAIGEITINSGMEPLDLLQYVPSILKDIKFDNGDYCEVVRRRCFLHVQAQAIETVNINAFWTDSVAAGLRRMIHIQGLRGNPVRSYMTAAITAFGFEGRFEKYVASIIDQFQKENPEQLIKIQEALQKLGLTDIVQTQRLNDTQIELRVGRVLGQADPTDTVNIADVGFGVSQVLPVIVALLVAQPGQLVYIEQPEIHLHPRAQIALSEIFADAANRGVRVVVETHSELFLLGVQSLVAEDKLDPKEVKLHWFTRNPNGSSKVTSAELDTTGAFGDWPQDFGMTALALENRYLSAAEAKLWNARNGRSPN